MLEGQDNDKENTMFDETPEDLLVRAGNKLTEISSLPPGMVDLPTCDVMGSLIQIVRRQQRQLDEATKTLTELKPATPYAPLWEVKHEGSGPDHCYWASPIEQADYNTRLDSWQEFTEDFQYTTGFGCLIYRWDWVDWTEFNAEDPDQPDETLELFWIYTGSGIMAHTSIGVQREDEPAIREWLLPRAQHLRGIWEPLL